MTQITPQNITGLRPDEIFVFGSNVYGEHCSGAARTAYEKFGAKWGCGVGLQGQTYAIPTLPKDINTLKLYVKDFISFARMTPSYKFLVTEIGCGRAGYTVDEVAPLFVDAATLPNVSLPESFINTIARRKIVKLSFFTVPHHSNTKVFIDGQEIGKMPISCNVLEGNLHIIIKHLTNFRWKEIHFEINAYKDMDITAKFNPFWGTMKIYVDGKRMEMSPL